MNIQNLFPTPVAFANLNRNLTDVELSFVKNLDRRSNEGNLTSVDANLFSRPELSDIATFVNEKIKFFLDDVYSPINNVDIYVTQSWANYTSKGQFHHKHRHPNSFISGVFYVSADRDKDRIKFFTHKDSQINLPVKNYNPYNSDSWWFNVNSSDLVLFPSTLWHMVDTIDYDGDERISIAFNTFLRGDIGDDLSKTGLHL